MKFKLHSLAPNGGFVMMTFLVRRSGMYDTQRWVPHCWVNVQVPDPADKHFLLNELQIPEAFYNDTEDVNEQPRIEVEEGWFFILMRIPFKGSEKSDAYSTVPLGIIFKNEVFVTITFYQTEMVGDLIRYTQRKRISKQDNLELVLRMQLSSSAVPQIP